MSKLARTSVPEPSKPVEKADGAAVKAPVGIPAPDQGQPDDASPLKGDRTGAERHASPHK